MSEKYSMFIFLDKGISDAVYAPFLLYLLWMIIHVASTKNIC